jgi:hypothetical protein
MTEPTSTQDRLPPVIKTSCSVRFMATSLVLNAEAFVFCDDLACQWFL